jgi:hypothetical protein
VPAHEPVDGHGEEFDVIPALELFNAFAKPGGEITDRGALDEAGEPVRSVHHR